MLSPLQYFLIGIICVIPAKLQLQAQTDAEYDQVKLALENRLEKNPDDATAWRLIGRLKLDRQEIESAIQACGKAVELSPQSASGHFDLARALLANEDERPAAVHFAEVIALAPESDYGVQAATFLQTLSNDSNVVPPRADLEPNRFGGIPIDTTVVQKSWNATFELGTAYNTNVELAPIQRDAITQGLGGAQLFLAPQFEARLLTKSAWEAGVLFNGYFVFNESNLQAFDLQDYQPGAFVQRNLPTELDQIILRTQYDFSLNEFQGVAFGRRHSISTSLYFDRENSNSLIYWTIDYSDFSEDGILPSQTSLDGWTNTLGCSYSIYDLSPIADSVRCGLDLQFADLIGSDFNYRGLFAYLETESHLALDLWLELQLGGGYREYPDFAGDPSRNETLWRASAELSRDLTDRCTLTAFSTFDQFASRNELFDTERFYSGLLTTFRW